MSKQHENTITAKLVDITYTVSEFENFSMEF